jgi:hypothetical protein
MLFAAGGVSNFGDLLALSRSFISRNIVLIGPGVLNAFGVVTADNCNLFGLNNFFLSRPVQREKTNAERDERDNNTYYFHNAPPISCDRVIP